MRRVVSLNILAIVAIVVGCAPQQYLPGSNDKSRDRDKMLSENSAISAHSVTNPTAEVLDQARSFMSSVSNVTEQQPRDQKIAYLKAVIESEMENVDRNSMWAVEAARRLVAEAVTGGLETRYAEDIAIAIDALNALCDDGISSACNLLGLLTQDGLGVQRDNERALAYFWSGARLGCVDSLSNLSLQLYENPSAGWSDDETIAMLHIVISLNPEDDQAMLYLGHAYSEGRGVTKDIGRARDWYKRAVDAGSDWAKSMLNKYSE